MEEFDLESVGPPVVSLWFGANGPTNAGAPEGTFCRRGVGGVVD